jgi:hypothetical protein
VECSISRNRQPAHAESVRTTHDLPQCKYTDITRHPAALFWGEDLTMMYNEAYKIEVAGNKHPELMGTGFSGNSIMILHHENITDIVSSSL